MTRECAAAAPSAALLGPTRPKTSRRSRSSSSTARSARGGSGWTTTASDAARPSRSSTRACRLGRTTEPRAEPARSAKWSVPPRWAVWHDSTVRWPCFWVAWWRRAFHWKRSVGLTAGAYGHRTKPRGNRQVIDSGGSPARCPDERALSLPRLPHGGLPGPCRRIQQRGPSGNGRSPPTTAFPRDADARAPHSTQLGLAPLQGTRVQRKGGVAAPSRGKPAPPFSATSRSLRSRAAHPKCGRAATNGAGAMARAGAPQTNPVRVDCRRTVANGWSAPAVRATRHAAPRSLRVCPAGSPPCAADPDAAPAAPSASPTTLDTLGAPGACRA